MACAECSKLFDFDRPQAAECARQRGQPLGAGPAQVTDVGWAAALAWHRLYGRWAQSLQVETGEPHGECDVCDRRIGPKENIAFVKRNVMERLLAAKAMPDPLRPVHTVLDCEGWTVCLLCMNRSKQKSALGEIETPEA